MLTITSPREVEPHVTAAIRAVTRYRLEHRLSLNKLAAEMKAAGCDAHPRTLLDLFAYEDARATGKIPRHRPSDLTKYNIVQFYFHLKENRKRRAAARRRRASTPNEVATAADTSEA